MAPVAQSNQVDKRACGYGGSIPTGGTNRTCVKNLRH